MNKNEGKTEHKERNYKKVKLKNRKKERTKSCQPQTITNAFPIFTLLLLL